MATDKSFGCRFANTEKCADSCFKCELFHSDYISREEASDLLAMALIDEWEPEYAQDRLSEIPAEDVRPVVRGKWQPWKQDRPPLKWYSCDYCGFHALKESNFCPNCGADMREEGTE